MIVCGWSLISISHSNNHQYFNVSFKFKSFLFTCIDKKLKMRQWSTARDERKGWSWKSSYVNKHYQTLAGRKKEKIEWISNFDYLSISRSSLTRKPGGDDLVEEEATRVVNIGKHLKWRSFAHVVKFLFPRIFQSGFVASRGFGPRTMTLRRFEHFLDIRPLTQYKTTKYNLVHLKLTYLDAEKKHIMLLTYSSSR